MFCVCFFRVMCVLVALLFVVRVLFDVVVVCDVDVPKTERQSGRLSP